MSTSRLQNLLDVKKKVAEETGFTEKQVSQVVHCFYDDWIKSLLTEFKYPIVLIEHLGIFSFRGTRYELTKKFIEKELKKYQYNLDNYTSDNKGIVNLWESKVRKLQIALFNINKLNEEYALKKETNFLNGIEKVKKYKQNNNV